MPACPPQSDPAMKLLTIFALLMTCHSVHSDEPVPGQPLNRLSKETSPYLRQHAGNPVDWYPWGEEAFAKARKENKPIFLSIGYSTCHWCHVMARESFSNKEIAALMNKHFINIKVDREERPDVDQVYMTFIQATSGGGGWPMSVWLTPELKPFVGGTYFPPNDSQGRPGFKSVVAQLAVAWERDEKKIREQAGQIIDELKRITESNDTLADKLPDPAIFDTAFKSLESRYDSEFGGFGDAPKFPRPAIHDFLDRFAQAKGLTTPSGASALEMSAATLRAIDHGGIHDHLGGGFHRYSVDRYWHVPHYEKMLYDQAQLSLAATRAYQLTGKLEFQRMNRDILDYVTRVLTHPEGGFFSAEDADSLASPTADHKTEGAFYIWTKSEIDRLLGHRAALFNAVYGVQANGNSPAGSDPHGDLRGQNTLILKLDPAAAAKSFKLSPEEVRTQLADSRKILFDAREKRPHPHLDDKVLTAWNGLMISAFARSYQQFDKASDLSAATRAAEFIQKHLFDKKRGVLLRSFRDGKSAIDAYTSDYAFLIRGLLDLYETNFEIRWLQWADALQSKQDELFLDAKGGGYFATTDKDSSVLLRTKEAYDGAEPSPNSIAADNLQRLATMLDQPDRHDRAQRCIRAFASQISESPTSLPLMLVSLDSVRAKPSQIVIVGKPGAPDTQALLRIIRADSNPNRVLLLADGGDAQKFLASHADFYKSLTAIDGKATAYVCENFVCQLPVNEPNALKKLLRKNTSKAPSSKDQK